MVEDLTGDPEENSSHYMAVLIEALSTLGRVEEALDVCVFCIGISSGFKVFVCLSAGYRESYEERVCVDSGEGVHQSHKTVS